MDKAATGLLSYHFTGWPIFGQAGSFCGRFDPTFQFHYDGATKSCRTEIR